MRRHLEIANLVRERDGQWRRLAGGFCALLQELPDGGDMHGVSGDGLGDGLLDRDGTPGVDEPEQASDGTSEVVPALCGSLQQAGAGRRAVVEAVESAPFASFALPSRQGVEVRGQLDLRAPVEAARVDRDARVAIEDVDDRGRGQEGERSSDAIVWDCSAPRFPGQFGWSIQAAA